MSKKEASKKKERKKPPVDFSNIRKKLRDVAEGIRALVRAKQGLSIDEDAFSGLIDVKDERERTRVNAHEVYAHSYMRELAFVGGDEWGIMETVASMEDHYLVSLDGEQRKEAILMQKAKTEIRTAGEPITLQKVETTKPPEQKKGFLGRVKKD